MIRRLSGTSVFGTSELDKEFVMVDLKTPFAQPSSFPLVFLHSFIYLFIRSTLFIPVSIYLLIHLFIFSLVFSFIRSYIYSIPSPIHSSRCYSFICLFTHSFFPLVFIYLCIHPFILPVGIHLFVYSPIYSSR